MCSRCMPFIPDTSLGAKYVAAAEETIEIIPEKGGHAFSDTRAAERWQSGYN